MDKRLVVASQLKATIKCKYLKCTVVTVANHRNQVSKVESKSEACDKLIQSFNCKKGICGTKLLKIYVYVLLIWLEFITCVTLLTTRFKPLIPLCILRVASGLQFLCGNYQIRIYVRHKFQPSHNFMQDVNSSCDNELSICTPVNYLWQNFLLI